MKTVRVHLPSSFGVGQVFEGRLVPPIKMELCGRCPFCQALCHVFYHRAEPPYDEARPLITCAHYRALARVEDGSRPALRMRFEEEK